MSSRRTVLKSFVAGSVAGSMTGLTGRMLQASPELAISRTHVPARVKRVIFLFMHGGPSQVDTFDYKPALQTSDGKPLHLTGKEYGILELLSLRKGTTLTKEMFLNHLYGGMDEPEVKIIDVFICKLRKKLAESTDGSNYIETVWGRGYVLRDPEAEKDKKAANA